MAYLTDSEMTDNTVTVGKVKIELEEPNYPGNDSDIVKTIIPNQVISKDPQVENSGNNAALIYLKVEVPQEDITALDENNNKGTKQTQDLFTLKDVSSQWELIRTETLKDQTTGKSKTSYVYAYKKPLESGKTTDKLFQQVQVKNFIQKDIESNVEDIIITAGAIKSTNVSDIDLTPQGDGTIPKEKLDKAYNIFLNQSGDKTKDPSGSDTPKTQGTATLLSGKEIHAKFNELEGNDYTEAIQESSEQPSATVIADTASLISTADSEKPVYAWFEKEEGEQDGTIKWWSEADKINAGSNLSYLCYNMTHLTDISGLKNWNTSAVTDMSYAFDGCEDLLNIDYLKNWDVSNVTIMKLMFLDNACLQDITPLANWNTSKVTTMEEMFNGCLQLANASVINDWDISRVTKFDDMFAYCQSHPEFTKRKGTWSKGTFTPAA